MIRKLLRTAAVFAFAALSGSVCAQSFTENFDNIALLAGNGWVIQNNSQPVGTLSWFQGSPVSSGGPFDAYNGAANAYIAVNYNSTAGTGTISNWLTMPNRTLRNGDTFSFFTRRPTPAPSEYPDRLELRMSTNGASTNVGATANAVGDFTTLLLSINPTLVPNVYPLAWTMYTVTISGLPAPTSGRLAFRYFVTNAGPTGANSDYIGIDNADYTPYVCPAFTMTASVGNGTWGQAYNTSLTQTGALGAPAFHVTAGALPPGLTLSTGGVISGTSFATGTFNFTVTVSDASGCSGSRAYSITIVPALPGAPQDVIANAGDAQVDVTWTAPSSDGGDPVSGYGVTCTGGNVVSGTGHPPITLTGLVNGTAYTCAVSATNSAGQGPVAISNIFTPMGEQTITFDAQSGQTYSPGGTFAIDPLASATSGLDVVYGSATDAVCTVSGTSVSIVSAGTCTLTADQSGDSAWNPAPQVTQSIVIAQAGQLLTFPSQSVPSHWFHAGNTFVIDPEASSAEPNSGEPIIYSSLTKGVCTVIGTTVTMVAGGKCGIAADQQGNDNYVAAEQVAVQVMLVVPTEADLWIQNSVDNATPSMGDTVTYTITVGNDGEADALGVRVLDMPPERLDPATVTWQCVDAVGTDCPAPGSGTGALDVTIAMFPKDAAVEFELLGEVIPAADPADDYTEFFNTATVELPAGSGLTDPPGNNADSAGVRVSDAIYADGFEELPPA